MGRIIAADQAHLKPLGDLGVDLGEELPELGGPVPTCQVGTVPGARRASAKSHADD